MPSVTFACPNCGATSTVELVDGLTELTCPHCSGVMKVPAQAIGNGQVHRCLICPSTELFVRKDFPQRLGLTIVVLGFAASCVTWYLHWVVATFGILLATALVDMTLYVWLGNVLECYRCHARYRGVAQWSEHPTFSLEIHERYRQQAARLAEHAPGEPPGTQRG